MDLQLDVRPRYPSFEWPRCFLKAVWSIIRRMYPESLGDSGLYVCVWNWINLIPDFNMSKACIPLPQRWDDYLSWKCSQFTNLGSCIVILLFWGKLYDIKLKRKDVLNHYHYNPGQPLPKMHDEFIMINLITDYALILCHIINWCYTDEMSPITNVILLYWKCLEWMFAILIWFLMI